MRSYFSGGSKILYNMSTVGDNSPVIEDEDSEVLIRLPGRIDDVMQSTVRLDRSIGIDRTDRERSLEFLRDRKAELGERLSKLRQQKEMLKLEEQQLKFQEEQLMVENNQLASEEDLLLNEISRSELERSVLNLFPETCAGLSAGNRAQSLFENRTETVQVLPSPQDKSTPMIRDTVATMLQPVAVAQKFQACKAPDNVISDPSRDDTNRVPSPLFTASYARVPATNLPDYVGRSNVEPVHVTERDIDVPSRMRNYDWAVGPQSQTRAPASSYPRQYQPPRGVDSLRRQPMFTSCRPVYDAGDRDGQWVNPSHPDSGLVNDRWGRRPNDASNNTAGQGVFSVPATQINAPRPKSPALYDGKSSCRDYLVQFEMVSELNRWTADTRALELATSLRGHAQGVLSDLEAADRANYPKLVRALLNRFEPEYQSEAFRAQMKARQRQRGEPLAELAQDIKRLVRKAYPEASVDVKEALACDAFTDAVGDSDMEWNIFQGKPKGVDDALRLALEYEAFQMGRSRRAGPRYALRSISHTKTEGSNVGSQDVATLLQRMAERLSLVETKIDRPQMSGENDRRAEWHNWRKCYSCGDSGHWQHSLKCHNSKRIMVG